MSNQGSSSSPFDLAVVGLGIMGAAAVYQATVRYPNMRVLGLEANLNPMHVEGSSHGESRMTRQAYSEGTMYVPLAQAAHREWDELATREGLVGGVLHRSGVLYMSGDKGDPVLSGAMASARAHNVEGVETFPAKPNVEQRFPSMRGEAGHTALWEPGAGWLEADNIRRVLRVRAAARGAQLHYGVRVVSWEKDAQSGVYRINGGAFEARSLLFCAGTWTGQLVPSLAPALHPKRRVLHWYRVGEGMGALQPGFLLKRGRHILYGFPPVDGLVKVGIHYEPHLNADEDALEDCHPDTVNREVGPGDDGELVDKLVHELMPLLGARVRSQVCLYNCTDDGHFVLDTLPGHPRVAVGAGFSGHGFKFAIVLGRLLVDMALGKPAGSGEFDLSFFNMKRCSKL